MTYLNDRNHDLFISYTHADDSSSYWVKSFALHLENVLGNQLRIKESSSKPVDVKVWKDNLLPSQGNLSERLKREIKDSSLFLVIMSPLYLLSEWCHEEGIMFVNSLKDKSDMRIFIVEKEETDQESWPDFLRDENRRPLLGFSFYRVSDVGEKETIPMKTEQGTPNPTADRKMNKFCDSISNTLYSFKHSPPTNIRGKNKSVFLAISPEAKAIACREELVNILKRWKDISILPPAESNMKPIGETLSEYLPKCQLFVQILGIEHGPFLTDRPNGLVGHQFEEAFNCGMKVFNWLIPKLNPEFLANKAYKQLIAELKPKTEGGTVVEGSLENFAQEIHDELEKPDPVPTPSKPHKYFVEMRYLVDDDEYGHEVGEKIKNFSSDIPIEPIYPTEKTKAKDIDQMREMAHGTVIVWTKNDKWVAKSWKDLDVDDKKVDRIAVCEPVPKPYDFGEKIRWANSAKRSSDLEEFIKKLEKSTT